MTTLTNFDKVKEFHRLFGHPINTTIDPAVFDNNQNLVGLRLALIEEEVRELREACHNKDIVEVADALADILYVVYGAGHAYGIDLNKAFDLVHESNMTKACATEQEALDSIEYIKQTEPRYKNPQTRYDPNANRWIVYDADTNKILKSKYYRPVDLSYVKNQ